VKKRLDLEAVRTLSAFGVVWFHSGVIGHDLAYSGLIIFIVLSIFLYRRPCDGVFHSIAKKARRLILPWLIWCILYSLLLLARGRSPMDLSANIFGQLLSGTYYHLWYLPFIFLVLTIIDLSKVNLNRPLVAYVSFATFIAAMLAAPAWRPISLGFNIPGPQYVHGAVAVLLGIFFISSKSLAPKVAGSSMVILALASLWRANIPGIGVPFTVCIFVFALIYFSEYSGRLVAVAAKGGSYTLGIYLVHPLFLALTSKFVPFGLALPMIAFMACLAWVAAMFRINSRFAATFM
jgi:fucose 4-O-acetylase-like acetyltransferase